MILLGQDSIAIELLVFDFSFILFSLVRIRAGFESINPFSTPFAIIPFSVVNFTFKAKKNERTFY